MTGEADNKDKDESRKIAIVLTVLVLILGVAVAFVLPGIFGGLAAAVEPGLGLRQAAIVAFFVTLITLVVVAVAAGDGLLGEIQFMLAGFFVFYLILWLMLAWVF